MTEGLLSVIIATRNRADLLADSLDAISRQDWPARRFEIVVADNNSTDGTRATVMSIAARDGAPAIRYLNVVEIGKSFAVNAALKQASGELLLFTDDDVQPEPDWIGRVVAAFDRTGADFVAGRIVPSWESAPPPWLSPPLYGVLAIPENGDTCRPIDRENTEIIPIGANMAVRRHVVDRIGGLRTDLGKLDGTMRTGEDHEFFLRMLQAGFRGMYEPSAIVCHRVSSDRLTTQYFTRWLLQNGQDVARLEVPYTPDVRRRLGVPGYLWRQAALDSFAMLRSLLRRDRQGWFVSVFRLIWFAGYVGHSWSWKPDPPKELPRGESIVASEDSSIQGAVWHVFTGTTTKYMLLAVNIGLGACLMPFTLHHLGPSQYGLWMLVASMTYYFQLLDLGYGNGLVRHLAEADAHHNTVRANQIVSTFVVVYASLGLLAGIGIVGIIFLVLPRFPHLDPLQVRQAQLLLAIMGVRVIAGFPMTVFGAVTTARHRFALNNVVALFVAVANALATYVVLTAGFGLVPLVASTTAIGLASYVVYARTARLAFPELRIHTSAFSRQLVREVTTYSAYVLLIDVAVQIGFNLDNVVIGAAIGTAAVAVYTVTLRLADYQRQLCSQFNGLLFPVVVRFHSAGERKALRELLIEGTRIGLILVIGVTVCLMAFGRQLIETWLGPGFESAVMPLYVLAPIGVILVGQGPLGSVLLGTGRHQLVAAVSLAEALGNLALSVILVRRYGVVGVAVGTAIPVLLANMFVLLPAACRQVTIGVGQFCRLVAAPGLAGFVPAMLVVMLLRRTWPADSLRLVLLQGTIVGLVYLATACTLGLPKMVRRRYFDFLRRRLTRLTLHPMSIAEI